MIDLSIHCNHEGLEIEREYPYNSQSIRLRDLEGGQHLHLYLPLEQWWSLRRIFPKASNYIMSVPGNGPNIKDHPAADAYAEEFYKAELAKLTPPPAPEPNDEVGEMLRSLPVIGSLNVDTNTFTPATPPQMLPIVEEPESDQVLY